MYKCANHARTYTQLWHKSDDENLEILIDYCVKRVMKNDVHWDNPDFIKMLYDDGILPPADPVKKVLDNIHNNDAKLAAIPDEDEEKHEEETSIFYDFVQAIYEEAGKNRFFDEFINEHYKREIAIWRHQQETLQQLPDYDRNETDFNEFRNAFKRKGYMKIDEQIPDHIEHDTIHVVTFQKRWKSRYLLHTEEQQLYFFAFIVAIVAMMKYMEIEYENQAIAIPQIVQHAVFATKTNVLSKHYVTQQQISDIQQRRCDVLGLNNAIYDETYHDNSGGIEVYAHDSDDIDTGICFMKNEVQFLCLLECTRMFQLQHGDAETVPFLWPWYRNSMHRDQGAQYERLLSKYNLAEMYSINEALSCLAEETSPRDDSPAKFDQIRQSFRSQRKFPAKCLLSPHDVARNLKLIRYQLADLLPAIINDAFRYKIEQRLQGRNLNDEHDNELEEKSISAPPHRNLMIKDEMYRILMTQRLEENRHSKELAINSYVQEKINGNVAAVEFADNMDLTKFNFRIVDDDEDNARFLQDIHQIIQENRSQIQTHFNPAQLAHGYVDQIRMSEEEKLDIDTSRLNHLEKAVEAILEWAVRYCSNNAFWPTQIKKINHNKSDFTETNLAKLQSVDIDRFQLPIFEAFVEFFFINTDREQHHLIEHSERECINDPEREWYRQFLQSWRAVPIWYTYHHDIVLLELVLRHGINPNAIIADLDGGRMMQYKIRLDCNETTINDPYYEFRTWCSMEINIMHRLKYVTNTIVANLESNIDGANTPLIDVRNSEESPSRSDRPTHSRSSLLFTDYQQHVHISQLQIELDEKREPDLLPRDGIESGHDPFIQRDIGIELQDALQVFNLAMYGKPLIRFIADQIGKHNHEVFWYILAEVMHAMPAPLALEAINDSSIRDTLRHTASPDEFGQIFNRLVSGASFPAFAALQIATFFDRLATEDMVRQTEWKNMCTTFEAMTRDEMNRIESNNLVFILLQIPLPQYGGSSMFQTALNQKRVPFLSNDRNNSLILYQYQKRFLKSEHEIENENKMLYHELLSSVFFTPFKFYLTAQGYEWVTWILFIMYYVYLLIHVSYYPISEHSSDVVLWTANIGYVLSEFQEIFLIKGPTEYFNFGLQGYHKLIDAVITIVWLFLFGIRLFIGSSLVDDDLDHFATLQSIYIFGFALQILLLSMRVVLTFRDTQYLGQLIRTIMLMMSDVAKFVCIFLVLLLSCAFGIWLITITANPCDSESDIVGCDHRDSFGDVTKYVLNVIIGSGESDDIDVSEHGFGVNLMLLVTLLATLIFAVLLIALMTTKFEELEQRATAELVYNKARTTYDYAQRGRLMPAPLNIVVLLLVLVMDIVNFLPALIQPNTWNIYAYVDYAMFDKLQNTNIWSWLCTCFCCGNRNKNSNDRKDQAQHTSVRDRYRYEYTSAVDVLQYYFASWYYDWRSKDSFYRRVHHRGCYASLISTLPATGPSIRGMTMAQYFDRYEAINKRKIDSDDARLLKQLSTDILICEHCYRPFSTTDIRRQLVTPYIAFLDYVSVITFVTIPVAWIPLIVVLAILTAREKIVAYFRSDAYGAL